MSTRKRLTAIILSRTRDYGDVLERQRALHAARKANAIDDAIIICQHAPVITLGKRAAVASSHVVSDAKTLAEANIAVVATDRGGDATVHVPGQVVAYPVVALRASALGARAYVEGLEDVLVDVCASYGIEARGRIAGREGVWVGDAKIAAVGVKISAGVSSHGVALNASPDLGYFDHIVPCGLEGYGVTSVAKELGVVSVNRVDVETRAVDAFARRFGYDEVFFKRE